MYVAMLELQKYTSKVNSKSNSRGHILI